MNPLVLFDANSKLMGYLRSAVIIVSAVVAALMALPEISTNAKVLQVLAVINGVIQVIKLSPVGNGTAPKPEG